MRRFFFFLEDDGAAAAVCAAALACRAWFLDFTLKGNVSDIVSVIYWL